jgi:hypothetical protein
MARKTEEVKVARIVVGLDQRARRRAALAAAAALAERMQAELVGLFVEDTDLFHLAGLPFAREVGFPSAARRSLDVAALERSLRAAAHDLRRACEQALARTQVSWTFRTARGSPAGALLELAAEARAATLLLPGVTPPQPPLAVFLGPGAREKRLAPALESLAELFGGGLEIHREPPDEERLRELLDAGRPVLIVSGAGEEPEAGGHK